MHHPFRIDLGQSSTTVSARPDLPASQVKVHKPSMNVWRIGLAGCSVIAL